MFNLTPWLDPDVEAGSEEEAQLTKQHKMRGKMSVEKVRIPSLTLVKYAKTPRFHEMKILLT